MASSLTDPYLKLSRAKEHIDSLAVELRAFYESKPYGFTSYEDIENARYILRAKLSAVPDKIPLILGDAVNCMRASLDQLVWSLAKLTTVIPNKTQFPIHDKSDAKSRKVFKRDLRGVPPNAVGEIDSFQPYKRTTGVQSHPLWILNAICILDKHRRIPANGSEINFRLPNAVMPHCTFSTSEDGGDISVPLSMKDQLQLYPTVLFKVNFGEITDNAVSDFDGIFKIYRFIGDTLLPRFLRFFP